LIFKNFSLADSEVNVQQNNHQRSHTSNVLLHYLVKLSIRKQVTIWNKYLI